MVEPSERSASDDHIEYPDYYPCYECHGEGGFWSHDKKRVCSVCYGKGIEEEEE